MQSFLDPAILFFVFGIIAGTLRSNLEIPPQISKFLSLYLLMALGLKGGFALAKSGLTHEVSVSLGLALLMAVLVPAMGYWVLRRFLSGFDAAAIAATYGSVSAVTFITAVQYLDTHEIAFGGHMAAAMALMESPAIIMAVLLANLVRRKQGSTAATQNPGPLSKVLHEALTDGAQLLLIGAMVVGILSGVSGQAAMKPFAGDLFKGMLAFFLLDMGLLAARNMGGLKRQPPLLIAYALGAPLVHASIALGLSLVFGLSQGNAALLMVLAASASYIAVPAVIRHAIPEANPSLYFGMSLGLTFPFNILLGIPLYVGVAQRVIPA
ncbi:MULTISPECIES: sodium-dependent bicarbonate transport family permease [Roseateles]|uniref:Sodium-dependent bicarbonate transport family permease n=1 Tax=Roseateles albus TaxID=2987525 RepID=A0ABT5KJD4_9BURK|nr:MULTISPECIES: sodium-dependent bicarbonate transport family permease [Roseateles]MCV2360139.1 sodium-dependent bicarbonate transport family permease [Paucibacter sp. TC2R-5]MDC8774054.1 sodium-dependent bicarbonate transport family permease [Roseateles albus]